MNKCIPQDWFLGYDQFTIYTWLNLAGSKYEDSGFLKTYTRPKRIMFNLFNNLDLITVDYAKDFKGNLTILGGIKDYQYIKNYLYIRLE